MPLVFATLCEMALDGGLSLSHLVDVLCHDSWPCVEVPHIDRLFPCVLYWAKYRRMSVLDGIFLAIDLMYVVALVCGYIKAMERESP